ncbi:MAG: C4-type zinc ribbon domain-containing protein [Desulfobacterota bacterium]|nr:C4-type zinc ribbon domain-containing protein [Thermodesulfobacteriota bacterium]
MPDQLELLKQLQLIDNMLKNLEKIKLDFPKKITQLEKEKEKRKQLLEKEKTSLDIVQKEKRKKELELSQEIERLKKSQDKLSQVKTNKEYQAVLKEIEEIKQHNSDIETEILICMEDIDVLTQKVKEAEIEYQNWIKNFEDQKSYLTRELERSKQELENQQTLRSQIIGLIEPELLKKFELIKERRQGLAIAAIQNGLCSGCNINIPPQKILEIRKSNNAIMYCPFCNRIIYFEEAKSENSQ